MRGEGEGEGGESIVERTEVRGKMREERGIEGRGERGEGWMERN